MRYAEATFVDREGETVTLCFQFEDRTEREVAHYDFDTFYIRAGLPHEWHDLTQKEARRRYDLRRFEVSMYLDHCTIHDYRRGPVAQRCIYGIEESYVFEAKRKAAVIARENRISEAKARAKLAQAQPSFDDLVAALA